MDYQVGPDPPSFMTYHELFTTWKYVCMFISLLSFGLCPYAALHSSLITSRSLCSAYCSTPLFVCHCRSSPPSSGLSSHTLSAHLCTYHITYIQSGQLLILIELISLVVAYHTLPSCTLC